MIRVVKCMQYGRDSSSALKAHILVCILFSIVKCGQVSFRTRKILKLKSRREVDRNFFSEVEKGGEWTLILGKGGNDFFGS